MGIWLNPQGLVKSLFGGRVGETGAERSSDLCAKGKQPVENQSLPIMQMSQGQHWIWTTPIIQPPSVVNLGAFLTSNFQLCLR